MVGHFTLAVHRRRIFRNCLCIVPLALLFGCGGGGGGAVTSSNAPSAPSSPTPPPISLAASSAQPGDRLQISGTFDPQAVTIIDFTDAAGNTTAMSPELVSATEVDVTVPFHLDPKTLQVGPATFSVSVVQGSSNPTTMGPVPSFQVADLPQTGVAAGTVTAEFLKQLQRVVALSTQNWQTIQSVSNGGVNVGKLVSDQHVIATQLTATQNVVAQVMAGGAPVSITTVSGNTVNLDSASLALFDRILVGYIVDHAPAASTSAKSSRVRAKAASGSEDVIGGMESEFDGFLSSDDLIALLAQAKLLRGAGNAMLAVGTGALILAGAPVETALGASAGLGAIIWGATTWAPAATVGVIQGGSALIFNGHGTLSDFSAMSDFLQDSYFHAGLGRAPEYSGELNGELGSIAKGMDDAADDLQGVFSPEESDSVASATQTLYASLVNHFPLPAVRYSGAFSGSVSNDSDCPGTAGITGAATVDVTQTSGGVSFSGSAGLTQQGGDICNDYSGNYTLSGSVDVFGSSLTVDFGSGAITGTLGQGNLAGSWSFQDQGNSAGGTFQLLAQ